MFLGQPQVYIGINSSSHRQWWVHCSLHWSPPLDRADNWRLNSSVYMRDQWAESNLPITKYAPPLLNETISSSRKGIQPSLHSHFIALFGSLHKKGKSMLEVTIGSDWIEDTSLSFYS